MKQKTVIVSLWSAGSCGRKQLSGILSYINSGRPWSVRIIMDPNDFTAATVAKATADGVDGFIAFAGEEASDALAATTVPTVLLSCETPSLAARKRNLAVIVNDNEAIGRKGAEHFLSLGTFASFAFVPDACGRDWSKARENAFRRRLEKSGHGCSVYDHAAGDLALWLRELPKPTAVMTPYDFLARDVIETCKKAGLSVPGQVAVLGVDDDDLICEMSRPAITSIGIDQERIGYCAANALERIMSGKCLRRKKTLCMPCGKITERESTRHVAPAIHLVRRIQSFIENHYREDIGTDDIAVNLGVSRRLAELRFSQSTGMTVREALEKRRLAEIKRYLTDTSLPIGKITALCGYTNELWVKYVFKRRFGMTMSEWRRRGS